MSRVVTASKFLRPAYGALAIAVCLSAGVAALSPVAMAQRSTTSSSLEWTAFRDSRLGFMLSYPAKIFALGGGDPTAALGGRTERRSGQIFRSRDGKAYLQAAAFDNIERLGPGAYKNKIARTTYASARITYDRLTETFFIISGTRGDQEFYERVTFSCGGRLINVWAMTYPIAERDLYNRIVEEVARTFRPAEGRDGCPLG
jgi:hypothetical protein